MAFVVSLAMVLRINLQLLNFNTHFLFLLILFNFLTKFSNFYQLFEIKLTKLNYINTIYFKVFPFLKNI